MMRKYISIIGSLSLLLLALSCVREELAEKPSSDLSSFEGIVLKLQPGSLDIVTRADGDTTPNTDPTREGNFDGQFNETVIGNSVDVFFFTIDADDNTPSIFHDSYPVETIEGNRFVSISASTEKMNSIFNGESNGNKAYVVVVANYGGSIDHSRHYSLNDLCALDLPVADWNTFPQSSFAMISDNGSDSPTSPFVEIEITHAGDKVPVQADVYLKRLAAKVTFRLTISDKITVVNVERDPYGNVVDHSLVEWTALLDGMTAYLQYGMKRGKLSGTPQPAPVRPPLYNIPADHDSIMVYNERPFKKTTDVISRMRTPVSLEQNEPHNPIYGSPEAKDFYVYEVKISLESNDSGPFYTYPVSWFPGSGGEPFIKLIIPWSTTSRTKYYYYKVPFKETPLKSNHWYVITLDVQILGGEDQQPVPLDAEYEIVPWEKGTEMEVPTEVQSARYLSVPITEWVMYNTDDLTIPITSSHDIQVVGYQIKPSATTQQPNASGRAFSAADKALTSSWVGTDPKIYNPFLAGDSNRYSISEGTDVGTVYWTKPNFNATGMYGAPVPVTTDNSASGWFTLSRTEIKISHSLINDTSHKTNGKADYDVAPYYIYFRVQHKDKPEYYKDILVEQRPAIMISAELNSDNYSDLSNSGSHNGYATVNGTDATFLNQNPSTSARYYKRQNYNTYWEYYLGGDPSASANRSNTNFSMYVIETSVLPTTGSLSSYVLGDSRKEDVDNLPGSAEWSRNAAYVGGGNNTRRLTNYYPVDSSPLKDDFIAPKFRIASSYGACRPMRYEDAFRRCASYQEDGYPAGRWRVPTKAEIMFMAQLTADGMIPRLLGSNTAGDNSYYWCNSGYVKVAGGSTDAPEYNNNTSYTTATYVTVSGSNNNYSVENASANGVKNVRCVYDEWFWEDTTYERLTNYGTFTWGDQLRSTVVKNQ